MTNCFGPIPDSVTLTEITYALQALGLNVHVEDLASLSISPGEITITGYSKLNGRMVPARDNNAAAKWTITIPITEDEALTTSASVSANPPLDT